MYFLPLLNENSLRGTKFFIWFCKLLAKINLLIEDNKEKYLKTIRRNIYLKKDWRTYWLGHFDQHNKNKDTRLINEKCNMSNTTEYNINL